MKCLLCLSMVSYTLDMHIGSLRVEIFHLTFWPWKVTIKLNGEGHWGLWPVKSKLPSPGIWWWQNFSILDRPWLMGSRSSFKMPKLPLYGPLYIGYAYRKSTGVEIFHLTLKGHGQGQRSWSRSLGLMTHQIEATVTWNMMVIFFSFSGQPRLFLSRSNFKMLKIAFVWSLIH